MIDKEGIGTSAVTNEPGKVYVRLDRGLSGEESGEIIKAYARIRPVVGWAVIIGTTPHRDWEYTVLDVDLDAMGGAIDGAPMLERHHETHEWGPPSGSDDVVYPRFLQLYDFGVWPYSGLTVEVRGGNFDPSGTTQVLNNTLVNLSTYQPDHGCLYALICISPTGTIEVVPGQVPDGFLSFNDIPAAPSTDHWEIAAVRLCAGVDTIIQTPRNTNIVDLRFSNIGWAGKKYGGHAAFTLTSEAENNLLSTTGPVTQILGLDSQPSGTVFAAPTGADDYPSFRFLADSDMPDIHAHYPGTIEDGDLAEQYLNGDGSRVGATLQAQDFGANGIKADLIAESTGAAGVYFPDEVGIGIAPVATSQFYVSNTAINTVVGYTGAKATFTKTAGVTDFNDAFIGFSGNMALDQVGGEIGYMYGFFGGVTVDDGSVGAVGNVRSAWGMNGIADINGGTVTGDAIGAQVQTNVQGGTVTGRSIGVYGFANLDTGTATGDVYGGRFNCDIQGTMTAVGANVYGVHISVDDDQGAVGTVYGLYFDMLTGVDYAIYHAGAQPSLHAGIFNISGGVRTAVSDDDVSVPPQNLELDAAFGTPEALGDGFIGILDDAGLGSNVYICVVKNGWWWYQQLTGAVDP
jgi:hypothetical protein